MRSRVAGQSQMLGKRGLSPLISTIFLIALAVALGTLIMNWSSRPLGADVTCESTVLTVQKAFGKDMICFNTATSNLRIVVKNSGDTPIDSVVYRRVLPDFSTRDLDLPNSKIEKGNILETEIGFQKTDKVHIEFIPRITSQGEKALCADSAIIKEVIEDCPR